MFFFVVLREHEIVLNACPNSMVCFLQIAEALRSRMMEVVFEEWTDSLYAEIDRRSYYVWAKYNWWMVPWWHLVGGVTEDSSGSNATSASTITRDVSTFAISGSQ